MKTLITTLISCMVVFSLYGQGGPLKYEEVIQAEGMNRDQIYQKARAWFSESFKNMESVLDIQDKETGELIGRFTTPFNSETHWGSDNTGGHIEYDIKVLIKDGRLKCIIENIRHKPTGYLSFGLLTTDEECPVDLKGQSKKWENKLWK